MTTFTHHHLFCRRFWFWNALVVFSVLIVGGFAYIVYGTNIVRVKTVVVNESDIISKQSVRSAAIRQGMKNFPLRFLFGPDTIVFWYLREKEIEREITRELPLLAQVNVLVDIGRQKKVSLTAQEKKIAGVWCANETECFAFDEKGTIFAPMPHSEGTLLLRIEDKVSRPLVLGQKIIAEEKWFENMMNVVRDIKESGVALENIKINDFVFREWAAVLPSGLHLYFSFDFVPENFASVFKDLMNRLAVDKLTYLDFRVPKRVYYK